MAYIKVELDNLEITSNARFYKLKRPLNATFIKEKFDEICDLKNGKSKKIIKPLRFKKDSNVFISGMVFYTEVKPPFIKELNFVDVKYSYILLFEIDDILVVSSLNVPNITKKFERFIDGIGYDVVANTFADANPKYEKVRMQNTSIMERTVRKRTLEGSGLENHIFGQDSIALSLSISTEDSRNSITMSTSRISSNNGRGSIRLFINWAKKIIQGLKNADTDKFIETFAKPVTLSYLQEKKLKPTGILLNLYRLEDQIFNNDLENLKISKKKKDGTFVDLEESELKEIFEEFREPLLIKNRRKLSRFVAETKNNECRLEITTKSILIRIPKLNNCYILYDDNSVKESVAKFFNSLQNYTITFSDPNYIYTKKELFERKSIFDNIESYLKVIKPSSEITKVTNEKAIDNKLKDTDIKFHKNTLFGVVEDKIWNKKGHLICDDLGDEWADHIALTNSNDIKEPPEIEFFLSKHGDETTSASKFHDIIGQANKNIGSIYFDEKVISEKIKLWKKDNYANTKISKLRSGTRWSNVEKDVKEILENPLTIRKMYLVISFLSKSSLEDDIKLFLSGDKTKKHIPQLIWFLSAYINQLKENRIQPYIICKP